MHADCDKMFACSTVTPWSAAGQVRPSHGDVHEVHPGRGRQRGPGLCCRQGALGSIRLTPYSGPRHAHGTAAASLCTTQFSRPMHAPRDCVNCLVSHLLSANAVQVTALGQPKLLERVSDSLVSVHNLFRRFDEDLNGVVTRDEFEKVHGTYCYGRAARLALRSCSSGCLDRCSSMLHLRSRAGSVLCCACIQTQSRSQLAQRLTLSTHLSEPNPNLNAGVRGAVLGRHTGAAAGHLQRARARGPRSA